MDITQLADLISKIAIIISAACGAILALTGALAALGIKRSKRMEQMEKAAEIGAKAAEQWAAVFKKANGISPSGKSKMTRALDIAQVQLPSATAVTLAPVIESKVLDLAMAARCGPTRKTPPATTPDKAGKPAPKPGIAKEK